MKAAAIALSLDAGVLLAAAPGMAAEEADRKAVRDFIEPVAAVKCEDAAVWRLGRPGYEVRTDTYLGQGLSIVWINDDSQVAVIRDFSVLLADGYEARMNLTCLFDAVQGRIIHLELMPGYRTTGPRRSRP